MQSVLNSLRTRLSRWPWRRRTPQLTDVVFPLYQRTPPLWAQWTYTLVACDIFMTFVFHIFFVGPSSPNARVYSASAVELTWNHWTEPNEVSNKTPASNIPSDAQPSFKLRPIWQRLGLCVIHLGIGVGAAVALIGSHTRVIRTLCVLPHPTPPRSTLKNDQRELFLQCSHHWKNRGRTFPMNSCRWYPGRDDTEMILRIDGQRGHWWLGLDKAKIHGRDMSLAASRSTILGEWDLKQQKTTGWKSGPILAQKS
jgi:hypothetical protein